jgi:uncharacterized surface protein with fasciclin (FAS1) repeats
MQKTTTGNGRNLMDFVSKQPNLNRFNQAIKSAALTERFLGPANYTVFAPTDDAFNKLPQDKVNNMLKPENREELKNLLLFHIVPGSFKIDDLKKAAALKTEAGRLIKVATSPDSKEVGIGNAMLTQPREETKEWCVYAVDAVLQPTTKAAAV